MTFKGYNKYQKGGTLMSLDEKLKNLPNGILSTSDLNKNNLKNYEISRLCKAEKLKRISNGYYYRGSLRKIDYSEFIRKICPDAVFCLRYALFLHTNRTQKYFDIAIPRSVSQATKAKIEKVSPRIKCHYVSGNLTDPELGFIVKDGIPTFDYERTICDFFKFQRYINVTDEFLRKISKEYVAKIEADSIIGKKDLSQADKILYKTIAKMNAANKIRKYEKEINVSNQKINNFLIYKLTGDKSDKNKPSKRKRKKYKTKWK